MSLDCVPGGFLRQRHVFYPAKARDYRFFLGFRVLLVFLIEESGRVGRFIFYNDTDRMKVPMATRLGRVHLLQVNVP